MKFKNLKIKIWPGFNGLKIFQRFGLMVLWFGVVQVSKFFNGSVWTLSNRTEPLSIVILALSLSLSLFEWAKLIVMQTRHKPMNGPSLILECKCSWPMHTRRKIPHVHLDDRLYIYMYVRWYNWKINVMPLLRGVESIQRIF